jgi:putative hemolysin
MVPPDERSFNRQSPAQNPDLADLYKGLPCGRIILKLAENEEERKSVFKLRYNVFNEELGEGLPESQSTQMDQDIYDDYCDHLMVIADKKVVGTYRLLWGSKKPNSGFYSSTEFQLTGLHLPDKDTVELGRGCIQPEYRKQTTLMALFWGLHRYVLDRKARHLIGCGSLPPMSHDSAEATYEKLVAMGKVKDILGVGPLATHAFKGDASKGTAVLPPLIGFYLEFGAQIVGRPAFDSIFGCHDFLMLFDMENLSEWGSELLARFDRRLNGA